MTVHISDGVKFGEHARQLRLQAGLSNRVAAKKIGVAEGTLIRIESGIAPLLTTAMKLLRFYGQTVTVGQDPGEGGTEKPGEETS